jgi:hypothetical protein
LVVGRLPTLKVSTDSDRIINQKGRYCMQKMPGIVARCVMEVSQVGWEGKWMPHNGILKRCAWKMSKMKRGKRTKLILVFTERAPGGFFQETMVKFVIADGSPISMANKRLKIRYDNVEGFWLQMSTS